MLVVRSKVPRRLNYLKRERRWSSLTSPLSHCNQVFDRQPDRKPLGLTFPGASEMECVYRCGYGQLELLEVERSAVTYILTSILKQIVHLSPEPLDLESLC